MKLHRSGVAWIFLLAVALAGIESSTLAASANYAGLVYSGNPDTGAQSGFFEMSVSANRFFDGRIFIGDRDAGFDGRFDTSGAADIVVEITVDNSCYECDPPIIDIETRKLWDVHFQLSPAGESIHGSLHFRHGDLPDGTLSGKLSSFNRDNPVPSGSNFTFVLAGSGDPANTNFPTGNGFGMVTINPSGTIRLSGSLADKSAFSQASLLCDDGTFPVFASLYNDRGMIQGWMAVTNSADADLAGDVSWVKPKLAGRTFYPSGFTNNFGIVGSRYSRTNPVLNWTNGVVVFQGGKLNSLFTNNVLLNAKGKIVNTSDNKLTLKIQPSSGRFNGSVKEPLTGDRISFSGIILQKENSGFGYFPDAPLSGQVMLGPATPP